MKTTNIIIGLNDNDDSYLYVPRSWKPPAVHHAIVLGIEESTRYVPVCGVNPHEGWTAEDTQDPVNCKKCLAWLAKPRWKDARQGLFGAIIRSLVGEVRQETSQDGHWVCTGCGNPEQNEKGQFNHHKPGCPWPMLNEMLVLE